MLLTNTRKILGCIHLDLSISLALTFSLHLSLPLYLSVCLSLLNMRVLVSLSPFFASLSPSFPRVSTSHSLTHNYILISEIVFKKRSDFC